MENGRRKKNDASVDKYKDESIRFEDKENHYELIFTDEFNIPSSGMMFDSKSYTLITDIVRVTHSSRTL